MASGRDVRACMRVHGLVAPVVFQHRRPWVTFPFAFDPTGLSLFPREMLRSLFLKISVSRGVHVTSAIPVLPMISRICMIPCDSFDPSDS